jgi:hypothetical protein
MLVDGERREIPCPNHFSVSDDRSSLRISFRWISAGYIYALMICFFSNSFLVRYWYWMVFRPPGREMWLGVILGIPFTALGLIALYATLAGLINRTVIKVTSEFISVRHGPLPWRNNRSLRIDQLEQLYCNKHTKSGSRSYSLNGQTKEGNDIDLLADLDDPAKALFIKQEVERWLTTQGHSVGRKVHY